MSFSVSPVLSRYIGKRFIGAFGLIYGGLLMMIYLIDAIQMIRDLSKYNHLTMSRVVLMTALRLPLTGLDLMPFAILIAAVFTFWRLTRTSELIVVRATGVSAWQFLFAPIIIGLTLAVLKMVVLNPIGAVMLGRYEHMESKYMTTNTEDVINIAKSGLWLRQKIDANQIAIIHAANIKLPEWSMNPVTAFFFDKNNKQTHRIDSESAELHQGEWIFYNAWVNATQQKNELTEPAYYEVLKLPTGLKTRDIMNRFASPRTIPFWRLPDYARIMQSTGFESNPLWARYYSLLAEPFLNTALIIIAAALSLRSPRMQKNWWLVLSTITVGFMIFFMGDFLEALGISDKLPLMFAAFVPATISLFMGLTALLYLEDG